MICGMSFVSTIHSLTHTHTHHINMDPFFCQRFIDSCSTFRTEIPRLCQKWKHFMTRDCRLSEWLYMCECWCVCVSGLFVCVMCVRVSGAKSVRKKNKFAFWSSVFLVAYVFFCIWQNKMSCVSLFLSCVAYYFAKMDKTFDNIHTEKESV